jgi:hypothetical protein
LESPIKVVQEVFSAGDTKAGIQTVAFNLPNDERVRTAKGSKKVMLKNISEAKYNQLYIPLTNKLLDETQLPFISFERWFTHILMHEVSHGLGPGELTLQDGSKSIVSKQLQECYSTIEECKADIGGIYTYSYLCKKGVFPITLEPGIYPTYLGGIFRSIRFGTESAHARANMIAYNYIVEKGGFVYSDSTQRFSVDDSRVRSAVSDLLQELLLIEAKGDYQGAKALIDHYNKMPEPVTKALEQMKDLPVDIRPVFEITKNFPK